MGKVEFLNRLKNGLRFRLPRGRIKEIIAEYERYFEQNKDMGEEEIVAACGDINLIIVEHLGADMVTHLPVRVLILIILSFAIHRSLFDFPVAMFVNNEAVAIVFSAFLTLIFGVVFLVVVGRSSVDITRRFSRRIVDAYILNFLITTVVGVLATAAMFTLASDVYIFEIIDSFPTISPSNIGYVFFTILSLLNGGFILAAAAGAFSAIRIGFWSVPIVFINLISCSYISRLVIFLSSLTMPEDIQGMVGGYIAALVTEIIFKALTVLVFMVVAYLLLRRRNVSST